MMLTTDYDMQGFLFIVASGLPVGLCSDRLFRWEMMPIKDRVVCLVKEDEIL